MTPPPVRMDETPVMETKQYLWSPHFGGMVVTKKHIEPIEDET